MRAAEPATTASLVHRLLAMCKDLLSASCINTDDDTEDFEANSLRISGDANETDVNLLLSCLAGRPIKFMTS